MHLSHGARGCSRPGGTCGVFWCSVSVGGGLSGVLVSLHLSVGPPQTQCTIHGPLYQWHGCQASLYQCPDGQAPSQWPRGQSLCHMAAGDSDASSGSSEKVGCSAPPGAGASHRDSSQNFYGKVTVYRKYKHWNSQQELASTAPRNHMTEDLGSIRLQVKIHSFSSA